MDKNDIIARNFLAAERTHLANERTLLAYFRSALMAFIAAITILKLFQGNQIMALLTWCFVPLSLLLAGFGIYRYYKTKKKLGVFTIKKHGDCESETLGTIERY